MCRCEQISMAESSGTRPFLCASLGTAHRSSSIIKCWLAIGPEQSNCLNACFKHESRPVTIASSAGKARMDVCSLPFNKFIGLTLSKLDGRSVIQLTPCDHHLNHVGTVHASLISAIAEAAAGLAILERFPDLAETAVPVLRSAMSKYRQPATVTSALYGTGSISDTAAVEFEKQLASRGRALLDISVTVRQFEKEVFRGTYTFFAAAIAD